MKNDESKGLFGYDTVKKICIFIYFILVILGWVCIIINLISYIEKHKDYIDAIVILYAVIGIGLVPILVMLMVYPLYALAYISEKNHQIREEQEIIEHLVARIVINEDKEKDNNKSINNLGG